VRKEMGGSELEIRKGGSLRVSMDGQGCVIVNSRGLGDRDDEKRKGRKILVQSSQRHQNIECKGE
jgi:hypothetical protein